MLTPVGGVAVNGGISVGSRLGSVVLLLAGPAIAIRVCGSELVGLWVALGVRTRCERRRIGPCAVRGRRVSGDRRSLGLERHREGDTTAAAV